MELDLSYGSDPAYKQREATCFSIAAGLHALLLLWNPILMKSDWQPAHELVTIDIVDSPAPGAPAQSAPVEKQSLMDTLRNMLVKSNPEEIAHIAPNQPVVPSVAAPQQPLLQDRQMARPLQSFTPKSTMEDQMAQSNPSQINTAPKPVSALPIAGPTFTSRSFTGIKIKDMPFQTNEAISQRDNVVPIALGNSSPKAALGPSGPQLSEKGTQHGFTPTLHNVGGSSPMDAPSLGSGSSANIPLSGTGGTGNAPVGVHSGQSISNRTGSPGLVNRLGGSGSGSGSGLQGIPSAARTLDETVGAGGTGSGTKKASKGVDITGPLSNRAIVKKVIPQYPAWAEEQGIVGSVQIYFTVDAAGNVRPDMSIKKTTGNANLDQIAIDALKQWKFAASNSEGEWGLITFNFSLSS